MIKYRIRKEEKGDKDTKKRRCSIEWGGRERAWFTPTLLLSWLRGVRSEEKRVYKGVYIYGMFKT